MSKEIIEEKEFEAAEQAAENEFGTYEHTMSREFTYEGKTYTKLKFDWASLTGQDAIAIEQEMAAQGRVLVAPEFNGLYLSKMAARACTPRLGSDVLLAMPLVDFNNIRNHARSFMLRSAQ